MESYQRELGAYIIIRVKQITDIGGHHVPQLVQHDDGLLAVEMSIVAPPYLLDFASAYLPQDVPDFPDEIWEQYQEDLRERFGDKWALARPVLDEFERRSGLVLLDPHLANLRSA